MKRWTQWTRQASALCLMGVVFAAWAVTDLPPGYPSSFDWSGYVDELELSNSMIIINDRQFVLSSGARLHGPKGTAGTSSLHKGMPVGVRVDADGQTKTIVELWLLPDRQQD